jgi:hypothetical protein
MGSKHRGQSPGSRMLVLQGFHSNKIDMSVGNSPRDRKGVASRKEWRFNIG